MAQKGEVTSTETKRKIREAKVTHGNSRPGNIHYRVYSCWVHMKGRCLNPSNHAYADYGGRGIDICDRWMKFENFLEDMGPRPHGGTIERKDNSKGYSPDNCHWENREKQARNRRSNRVIQIDDYRFTVAEWSEKTGIREATIAWRINRAEREGRQLTGRIFLPTGYKETKSA